MLKWYILDIEGLLDRTIQKLRITYVLCINMYTGYTLPYINCTGEFRQVGEDFCGCTQKSFVEEVSDCVLMNQQGMWSYLSQVSD